MQFTRLAIESVAVPVKDPIGGVAVLLNFNNQESLADRMETATRDEDALSGVGGGAMEGFLDGTVFQGFFKLLALHALLQSGVDGGTLGCVEEIPALGFGFASEFGCAGYRGMNLNGEPFAGIEEFDQEREARRGI